MSKATQIASANAASSEIAGGMTPCEGNKAVATAAPTAWSF